MDINECETVKDCFMWAEQEWPGFWDFANQLPMTEEEICDLSEAVESDDDKFQILANKLLEVGKIDKTQEALRLLMKGAGAFVALERRYNEIKKPKRPNTKRGNTKRR